MNVSFKYSMYGLMCDCEAVLEDNDGMYMEELKMSHKCYAVDTIEFCEDDLWFDIEKKALKECENEYKAYLESKAEDEYNGN